MWKAFFMTLFLAIPKKPNWLKAKRERRTQYTALGVLHLLMYSRYIFMWDDYIIKSCRNHHQSLLDTSVCQFKLQYMHVTLTPLLCNRVSQHRGLKNTWLCEALCSLSCINPILSCTNLDLRDQFINYAMHKLLNSTLNCSYDLKASKSFSVALKN